MARNKKRKNSSQPANTAAQPQAKADKEIKENTAVEEAEEIITSTGSAEVSKEKKGGAEVAVVSTSEQPIDTADQAKDAVDQAGGAKDVQAQTKNEQAQSKAKETGKDTAKSKKSGKGSSSAKKRDAVFQLKTKRTSDIIKAYITFTYRIMHPGVTPRLLLYGVLVAAPGIFFFKDLYWKIFFIAIGVALILLAFFRQYISLAITKNNDPDYKSGAEFEYDFYDLSATVSKNGEIVSRMTNYKDVTAFYYDNDFYYLALGKEVHVLPKSAFTVGEPSAFEEFIYKKSKKTCHWLPNNMRDRMKQRRARRAVSSRDMLK